MPEISNILICDMPVRFDSYKGCSHDCAYCFVKAKTDISKIDINESAIKLRNYIEKRRSGKIFNKIFDYDIPLHWGGVSDPFQPIEKIKRVSYECLKIFSETQYPFVVSTKNDLLATDEYLDILKDCNCAVQYSAVGTSYDIFEKGAPKFLNRVEAMRKISKHKRVIVRGQPLIPKVADEFIKNIPVFSDAGVYGVIIEFMKYKTNKEGLIKIRQDICYKLEIIKPIFDKIKITANKYGLKCFAGENRLRQYGDGLNCCSVGDLWKCHDINLNHILFENKEIELKQIHREIYGKNVNPKLYPCSAQGTKRLRLLNNLSYLKTLNIAMTDKSILSNYTINDRTFLKINKFKPFE